MHREPGRSRLPRGSRMTRRSLSLIAAGAAAAALTLPGIGVARAASAGAGGLVVKVTAPLPSFPCAACSATASGTGTGLVVGVDSTTKKATVALFKQAPYATAFNYHEACPAVLAGKPVTPPEGFANGTYTLGPGTFVGASGSAWVTGSFNYTRVGLTAVITLSGTQLHSGSATGPVIGPTTTGASVGLFIPGVKIGNCTTTSGGPATIQVVSVAASGG